MIQSTAVAIMFRYMAELETMLSQYQPRPEMPRLVIKMEKAMIKSLDSIQMTL